MNGLDLLNLVYRYLAIGFFIDLTLFTLGVWAWQRVIHPPKGAP